MNNKLHNLLLKYLTRKKSRMWYYDTNAWRIVKAFLHVTPQLPFVRKSKVELTAHLLDGIILPNGDMAVVSKVGNIKLFDSELRLKKEISYYASPSDPEHLEILHAVKVLNYAGVIITVNVGGGTVLLNKDLSTHALLLGSFANLMYVTGKGMFCYATRTHIVVNGNKRVVCRIPIEDVSYTLYSDDSYLYVCALYSDTINVYSYEGFLIHTCVIDKSKIRSFVVQDGRVFALSFQYLICADISSGSIQYVSSDIYEGQKVDIRDDTVLVVTYKGEIIVF
jgi:hypothetical protein